VRLFNGEKSVITGAADRTLKVWDIARRTYRQNTTLHHSSTATCVDVAPDAVSAVSGHIDGGLRFWDLNSGSRAADVKGIQEAGVTSVQFDPSDMTRVLASSLDSTLKIIDIRSGQVAQRFSNGDIAASSGWSNAVFSPDGRYLASGSTSNGTVFVWEVSTGKVQAKLDIAHQSGVVGIDWCRGGSAGQQVATIDRKGVLVLWA
jgi:autophagy-related protein 16-1